MGPVFEYIDRIGRWNVESPSIFMQYDTYLIQRFDMKSVQISDLIRTDIAIL